LVPEPLQSSLALINFCERVIVNVYEKE